MQSEIRFQRDVVASQLRSGRNNPGSEEQAKDAGDQAQDCAFENEETHQPAARGAERSPQRDLAPAGREPDEQQVGDIAARDEQNRGDRREQSEKGRAKISGHVFRRVHQCRRPAPIEDARILRRIAFLHNGKSGFRLFVSHTWFQATNDA